MKAYLDKKVVGIFGPTITKKTGLAVNIAKYVWGKYNLEAELMSADPRKLYKELTIVPVPVYPPFDKKLKIHLFGILETLDQKFELYDYKKAAEKAIDEAHQRGHLPIIYGGSAMYISSVLENWNVPKEDKNTANFKERYGQSKPKYQSIVLIPAIDQKTATRWIADHTKQNIDKGLAQELVKLTKKYHINPLSNPTEHLLYRTLEYRHVLEYCYENKRPLEKLEENDLSKIQIISAKALRDYARRQKSWVRKMQTTNYQISSWQEARKIVDVFLTS